ncbi:hypothetical protein PPACK8108_LOCUS7614 [Phakopsora pachyrhizi]|uniref:Uncharacterized protein n=1 Tax=Phakopsora pachyrhizi TaxID=170000 RepID=A0AAV0AXQ3_PHAPC|nr:hypothetical protein PPACK8108_LOCUS7614 [Phakopsora pachyrhizi]
MVWRAEIDEQGGQGRWGRQVQLGLGSAFLGCVLGRWQSGQGRWGRQAGAAGAQLGFAGLGPRQVAVRAGQVGLAGRLAWLGRWGRAGWGSQGRAVGKAGAAGAWLGFAGQCPRAGQTGLGSALLGWVLGRWQSGVGRQAGQGRWGRQGLLGLGLALLGWVLGRWGSQGNDLQMNFTISGNHNASRV